MIGYFFVSLHWEFTVWKLSWRNAFRSKWAEPCSFWASKEVLQHPLLHCSSRSLKVMVFWSETWSQVTTAYPEFECKREGLDLTCLQRDLEQKAGCSGEFIQMTCNVQGSVIFFVIDFELISVKDGSTKNPNICMLSVHYTFCMLYALFLFSVSGQRSRPLWV